MIIQFEKLYEVRLLHNYYPSGISEDFQIEPADSCKRLLHNYGLIFRKTLQGFVVFYEVSNEFPANPRPLKPIEESIKFSFLLKPNNPYVVNYSNLPIDGQADNIYHLHNLNDNQQTEGLLLTSGRTVDHLTGGDRIELKPQIFNFTLESAHSTVKIRILDELNNLLVQKTVPVVEGILRFPVDLRGHHPGKYILSVDDEPHLVFYANSGVFGQNIFGIIDLFQDNMVPSAYRYVSDDHDVESKTYTVKIERRRTYWKYYVVLKYHSEDAEGLSIKYPPSSEPPEPSIFERQTVETLSDGATAVPFVSQTALPLQKESINNILLERGGNRPGVENLPNPSVATIKPSGIDNRIYSEIFVYL